MVYTPKRGAFAQTQYFDQQGTALPGMLANASDINLVDSGFVGGVSPEKGLTAGLGVVKYNTVGVSNRPGLNYDVYTTPTVINLAPDFAGIVVRNQFMRTNSAGEACYFFEDMCNVLSSRRVGGRIWVKLEAGSTYPGSPVYWITNDTGGRGLTIGAFSGSPIGAAGKTTQLTYITGTVDIPALQALGTCGFDIIERDITYKAYGMDFSGITTMTGVAAVLEAAFRVMRIPLQCLSVIGNSLFIDSTVPGAVPVLKYPTVPTTAGNADARMALGLSPYNGGVITPGTSGTSLDTVQLPNARFVDTFTPAVDGMALVELF